MSGAERARHPVVQRRIDSAETAAPKWSSPILMCTHFLIVLFYCHQVMLVGSLVHQLFQEVVKVRMEMMQKTPSTKCMTKLDNNYIEKLLINILSQSWAVRDLYGLGVSEEVMLKEMKTFVPSIRNWINDYLGDSTNANKVVTSRKKDNYNGRITEVEDIEENFWSPKLGLKGKVDMTIKVKDFGGSRSLPLELKTGENTCDYKALLFCHPFF